MKPLTHITIAGLLWLASVPAFATDVSGDQSGTWTLAQSPYRLVGDVRVPPGLKLTIEPGVVVNAAGYYKLTVAQGTLLAVGTPAQSILLTAENHTTGWRGIRLEQATDFTTISYCTIEYAKGTGAYPDVRGGAIYCLNCSPTISHNELRYNYSHNANSNGTGAGVTTETSSALILDNYIHHNQADSGGGVCLTEYGTPLVIGNLIANNTGYYAGGGIYAGARSSPRIERNVILHNTANGWGGGGINSWTSYIFYNTYPIIRDNVIVKNTTPSGGNASGGGGVYCRYDRAVLTGNTIADNQGGQGGGLYVLNYPPQAPLVTDCIIWGNTAPSGGPGIYLNPDTGSAISVNYSDVQGGWDGTGNLAADPLFVGPGTDDYHLTAVSPCVDTGDPNFVPQSGETDLDGQARVWDGDGDGVRRIDMGADELGSHVVGDLNCDGVIDFGDIDPFVLALTGEAAYQAAYPKCWYGLADVNLDGVVNFADIDPFVALLSGQ